jgi:hypothetical protein
MGGAVQHQELEEQLYKLGLTQLAVQRARRCLERVQHGQIEPTQVSCASVVAD